MPTYVVSLLGKYLCYAMLALALDLVWGYCGILSLGHGAFFALGGYAMGMYLMRQIGTRGVYAHPVLPDFMVFLNWKELPWYWYGFDSFPFAMLMVAARAGAAGVRVRLARLPQPRHRRLPLDHHAGDDLRAAAGLLPQRHGLRRQQRPHRLQGHPRLQRAGAGHARGALRASTVAHCSALMFVIARVLVTSTLRQGAGRHPRRGERARVSSATGSSTSSSLVFTLSACMAGIAGALYVPQVGIINPSEFSPANSIEAVIWVAVGGRGTLIGAVVGAFVVNFLKTDVHDGLLRAVLAVRAGRAVRARHAGPAERHRRHARRAGWIAAARPISGAGTGRPRSPRPRSRPMPHGTDRISQLTTALLYLDGVSVSFDGFKALNNLSLVRRAG